MLKKRSEPVYKQTAAQRIIPVSDPECKRYLLKTPLAHQFDRYSKDPDSRRLDIYRNCLNSRVFADLVREDVSSLTISILIN